MPRHHEDEDEADKVRKDLITDLRAQRDRLERQRTWLIRLLVATLIALAIGGGPDALRWLVGP